MMERISKRYGNNGDAFVYVGSHLIDGGGGWYNAKTRLRAPDCIAHILDYLHGGEVGHLRVFLTEEEAVADAPVDAFEDDARIIDATDAIMNRGGEGEDTRYAMAFEDMDNLTEIGSGQATMTEYSDDEEHPADAIEDYPVEMVA